MLPGVWLRTGDMVRREDSFLWMADRRRELILTVGFNVYPSQVEAAIRDMDGVADVAVVGLDSGAGGELDRKSPSELQSHAYLVCRLLLEKKK